MEIDLGFVGDSPGETFGSYESGHRDDTKDLKIKGDVKKKKQKKKPFVSSSDGPDFSTFNPTIFM